VYQLKKCLIVSTFLVTIPCEAWAVSFTKPNTSAVAAYTQVNPPVFRSIDEFLTCIDQNSRAGHSKTIAAEICENAAKKDRRIASLKQPA
jgi:hypothetical protein